MPFLKNILYPLAKSVLISLQVTIAAASTDTATHKKIFGSDMTKLIISNEEKNDIIKIGKPLEESVFLEKVLVKQLKMNQKKKSGFLSMLLGSLGLLENLLAGIRAIRAGEGTVRAGQNLGA